MRAIGLLTLSLLITAGCAERQDIKPPAIATFFRSIDSTSEPPDSRRMQNLERMKRNCVAAHDAEHLVREDREVGMMFGRLRGQQTADPELAANHREFQRKCRQLKREITEPCSVLEAWKNRDETFHTLAQLQTNCEATKAKK
jgi:hypothetical protein